MTTKRATTRRTRLERWMLAHEWNHRPPRNGLRARLWALASDHRPWWDWGHRLMALTGVDEGGNWAEPTPPTWWYRLGRPKRMARTNFPRYPLSTLEVVTDYHEFKRRTEGLNEDELWGWRAICVDQDGDLKLGRSYWGQHFASFGTPGEIALLRRYLKMWRRSDWWGLRPWLYAQGLHAAVHRRRPGACNQLPTSGGYQHWYCQLDRGHGGLHRFKNYRWGQVAGEELPATHVPERPR